MTNLEGSTGVALGIDVGGTKIQGAYLYEETVTLTRKLPTPAHDYETFLHTLTGMAEEVIRVGGHVHAIGLGIPGTVVANQVTWVPNLPFLNGKNLAEDLGTRLGANMYIANDAQLALRGEMWQGAAQNMRNAILVSVGTGVGGAIMMDGKIVEGFHGSAGAFGWLKLDWQAASHPEHGYVEQQASGSALDMLARQLNPPSTSYGIIARAREGQAESLALIQHVGTVLGVAFASIASILDPEALLFSGGLADAFDLFAPIIRTTLRETGSPSVRSTPIVVAHLGKNAAAYGALHAALSL